ncbi:male-enhanced antigen 1 [Discoglossus pictus]
MGPERVFPNQAEDLGEVQEPPAVWSGGEEDEEEEGEVQSGYQYQPLNQDPEEGVQNHGDIQERLQAMGLHLPDPPADSDDEEERETVQSSIPMDPAHVELVKKTMAGVKLSSVSVPVWAQQLSETDWENLVNQTIQSRTTSPPPGKK